MSEETSPAPGGTMSKASRPMEVLLLLGIFALWIILQVWVLPKAGVPT